ncbi:MAG TPA: tyrosine--tRNA ligase [Candidatus Limnocylindrales bacterium]|nr:tyrosine--tRNA ligase [Candidatus Limnocylindrales bacterium]
MENPESAASERHAFLRELEWRGLLQDESEGFARRLTRGPISGYVGFDPTSPSLQVGNLMPIAMLVALQRTGAGSPVAVVGGGTGMIGDPSGKSAERNLLDDDTLDANRAAIRSQLERFLDFDGKLGARLFDNRDWLAKYGLIEFLRDIGKHFPLSYMLAKDSVSTRMDKGISYTEFSYMTLQATDFLHLYREHGVELQMGGADQWGNITAGTELIRRAEGLDENGESRAFAVACPLLLTSTGAKFGKTAEGTVWLSADLTSPYEFYQYWIGQDDRDVAMMLRRLTLLEADEIYELEEQQRSTPEKRPAHRRLASVMTARVHGEDEARRQEKVAEALFAGQPLRDPEVLDVLFGELDHFEFGDDELTLDAAELAVAGGLFTSKSEARRMIQQGGFSINDERVTAEDGARPDPIDGRYLVLRAGKKRTVIGRRREA